MRIAFDFNPILINRFSGFHTFGISLLQGFEDLREKPDFLLFHSRRFSKQVEHMSKRFGSWVQFKPTSIKMRWLENLWSYCNCPRLQYFTGDFDIYHCFHHLMPPTKGRPRILTVHDLRRYKLPELYIDSKMALFESAVKRSVHFMAVSHSTKYDLCDIFGISSEKIDVVPLAASPIFEPLEEAAKEVVKSKLSATYGTELERYFIMLSSPDPRKNIARTIKAFLSVRDQLPPDIKLVVVGNLPKHDEGFDSIDFDVVEQSVIFTGPVPHVKDLFQCAEALVFASLYEGFGIPILEAFGCGVPVIASNCSSMPEVAGTAALYVNPNSIKSISGAIVDICNKTELRNKLICAGVERAKQFSWQKTAQKTFEVYKKLV